MGMFIKSLWIRGMIEEALMQHSGLSRNRKLFLHGANIFRVHFDIDMPLYPTYWTLLPYPSLAGQQSAT